MRITSPILFFLLFCFTQAEASPLYRKGKTHKNYKKEYELIGNLYELIISDIDLAKKRIDSLKYKHTSTDYKDIMIDILLLEAELYRTKGDYSHMKLSMYQAMTWKNEHTSTFNKTLIDFYAIINQYVTKKFTTYENKLKGIAKTSKRLNFPYIEAKSYQALGKFYSAIEKHELAEQNFVKAKRCFLALGFSSLAYDVDVSRGINFYWKGTFDKALERFHYTKEMAKKEHFHKCYLNAILNLAEAHLFIEGNIDSSFYYYKIIENKKNEADIRDVYQCYWGLNQYYRKKNNPLLSEKYNELMQQVDEQIQGKMLHQLNLDIDDVYRKLQNERFLDDENNRQKVITLIVIFIGIFFLLIAVVFWFIIKEKGKLNFALLQQKDEVTMKKKLLDQALKEKEILLKEIHHRVKNNLQIISSLLSLQSKNIDDKAAKEAIFEGKDRIQAIALIHQKLYQNDTYATIEMKSYLDDLIEQLSNSYDNQLRNVSIKLITNDIILNLDTVVPLGLIICELVTNSFKYAFRGVEDPRLRIEISEIDGFYQLSIRDNGIGMKETFDFLNSPTLGVEIIQALTEQLDGTITYKSSEKGTSIKIKFKEVKNA